MAETPAVTAGTVANVNVGKGKVGGYFYAAPKGTALPTDATTALVSAYIKIGYVSEDGLTDSYDESSDVTKVKDWTGNVIKEIVTSYDATETFSLTVIETNEEILKQIYGAANVTNATSKITADYKGEARSEMVYVFETVLGDAAQRIIVPCGCITSVGDIKIAPGEVLGYEITIEARKDETLGICSRRIKQ